MKLKLVLYYITGITLAVSLLINLWIFISDPYSNFKKPLADKSGNLEFLSNTIDNQDPKNILLNFTPLRRDLELYTATYSGKFSFYLEYIPTGNSIGINEKQPFIYASLLKLPLVMVIYKKIESGTLSLTDQIVMSENEMDPNYGELWKKGPGTSSSVNELIEYTLKESDNTAYNMLRTRVNLQEYSEIFESLDIPLELSGDSPAVTSKNYVSILKSLYFSSFLKPKDSQEILKLLSKSTFQDGLEKYIPSNIPVSNKFGVRDSDNIISDCGIIYHPSRPYYLCIMEQYNNVNRENRLEFIQILSQKVFNFINSN